MKISHVFQLLYIYCLDIYWGLMKFSPVRGSYQMVILLNFQEVKKYGDLADDILYNSQNVSYMN